MSIVDSMSKKNSTLAQFGLSSVFAKRALFAKLEALQIGHLIVSDDEGVTTFGENVKNSKLVARIHIHEFTAYREILTGGETGAGESFMQGHWSSPDLVALIRVISSNRAYLNNFSSRWSWIGKIYSRISEAFRKNTKTGSRRNISAHYDLSNEFFSLFLDEHMMYSSAIYSDPDVQLEEASLRKLDHICQRLQLSSEDHLLEIGTGWGGMAWYAAKTYGCRVTTTTISEQQYEWAKAKIERENLSDRVTVLKRDYRDLTGNYDKIVSIEMIEAVGFEYYGTFFSKCQSLLKPDGLMLIQAITTQDQRFEQEKRNSDFIRKYIFPGGCLPSNKVLNDHASRYTDMHLVGLEDITLDYAYTIADWRSRFLAKLDQVKSLGFDERFIRMWDFYFAYCQGGFHERVINTSQYLFAAPYSRQLPSIRAC